MLFSPQIVARGRGISGSGGGGGFNPLTSLTGLIAWYDTSVTASITLSGSNVTALADQSGLGNNLGNGGLGRPLPYSATGFNTSFPGMTTTLSGNPLSFLEVASFPMGAGNTLTAWYVGTMFTAGSRILSYCKVGGQDFDNVGSWTLAFESTTTIGVNRNGTTVFSPTATASPAGHRGILTIDSSGVMTVYVDGVAGTPGTVSGNWVSGGTFDLFREASHDTGFGAGTISEAGVATGFSDATTVAGLDAYLKSKWGL